VSHGYYTRKSGLHGLDAVSGALARHKFGVCELPHLDHHNELPNLERHLEFENVDDDRVDTTAHIDFENVDVTCELASEYL
jgi:hypothetical protein